MTRTIPPEILNQHLAILGKTGAGKSHTARLAIEQAVAGGARVCILDPIKSDWWGLTSSRDGRKAGLPFHILGGPHGHVPLHSSAGKAVAEVVANGSLPLSIIDMADFEPGGPHRFFVDFAPTLLRKMRGVVYLVLEEAHLFAPKERSGIGQENLAIHWAKTLATAGRSKGIRLVLVTQRTQALHNALLGSCDTVIAHRLTAPADQAPVIQWLKANTSKTVLEQVSGSLSSLKTGEGWICAGEARLFERVHFPRIATYDNTATPTGQGETHQVTTAAVDAEQLRALIGEAVEQAKADDPRELRKQLAEKDRRIKELEKATVVPATLDHTEPTALLTDDDRALLEKVATALQSAVSLINRTASSQVESLREEIKRAAAFYLLNHEDACNAAATKVGRELDATGFQQVLTKLAALPATAQPRADYSQGMPARPRLTVHSDTHRVEAAGVARGARQSGSPSPAGLGRAERAILTAAVQRLPKRSSRAQLSVLSGYSIKSSSFANALGALRSKGLISGNGDDNLATAAGESALGSYDPLPTGEALVRHWMSQLGKAEAALLDVFVRHYPREVSKATLSRESGYSETSSSFANALGRLRTLELVRGLTASEEFFS